MRAEELANISVGYFCNYYDKVSKQARLYDCLKTIPENLINDFVRLRSISDQDIQKEEKQRNSAVAGDFVFASSAAVI